MGSILVSAGTDGHTRYVVCPDGTRLNLGAVSVYELVKASLARGSVNRVVAEYERNHEVMFPVNEERFWAALIPHPRYQRRSTTQKPLSALSYQEPPTMPTLVQDTQVLAKHVDLLSDAASKKASNIQEGVNMLVKLVNRIAGQNTEYYNVGKSDVKEVTDTPLKVPTVNDAPPKVKGLDKLAFDTYQANEILAQDIIVKAEQTTDRIARLEQAGRKFNASRARTDVLEVTSKVRGILAADLTANWVQNDLQKLSSHMNQLHGLFVKNS
jgi:hypothetical protein